MEPEWNRDNVNVYKKPKEGHDYITTVDVAKGRGIDYSTFSVSSMYQHNLLNRFAHIETT